MYVCTLFLFDKIYLVCSPITGSPWTPQLSLHNYYVRGFWQISKEEVSFPSEQECPSTTSVSRNIYFTTRQSGHPGRESEPLLDPEKLNKKFILTNSTQEDILDSFPRFLVWLTSKAPGRVEP